MKEESQDCRGIDGNLVDDSDTQYTPTPWTADILGSMVLGPDAYGVCQMLDSGGRRTLDEKYANAAFIVRAVNAYEELLRVAKLLITLDDDCRREPRRMNGLLSDARLMVEQAIAEAGGSNG